MILGSLHLALEKYSARRQITNLQIKNKSVSPTSSTFQILYPHVLRTLKLLGTNSIRGILRVVRGGEKVMHFISGLPLKQHKGRYKLQIVKETA